MGAIRLPQFTLEDRFHRRVSYVRVSITDRCNYRCVYCMPAGGVPYERPDEALTRDEWVRLIGLLARLGVERVRITGGEPLVRRDAVDIVAGVRAVPGIAEVMLTTNGHLLAERARDLRRAGLSRVNLSVDSLDPAVFRRLTRGGDLARVKAGAEASVAAGLGLKLNTVVVGPDPDDASDPGNVEELGALARYAWSLGAVVRFIEIMPMGEGRHLLHRVVSAAEIRARLAWQLGATLEPVTSSMPGVGPARYWRVTPSSGPGGEIGIISAMTEEFCSTCNRVRLSAKGQLRACLASDDEVSLAGPLRRGDDAAVLEAIAEALHGKRRGHEFTLAGGGAPARGMSAIGG